MNDMSAVIVPKSDQYNAEDFLAGPRTFCIEAVSISPGQEQPVSIKLVGETRVWRPCKSMSRCLVAIWGSDANAYIGKSLTLYGDPSVKWGGLEVGGIRISHMSHLNNAMTMALTATKGSKKAFTVKPLAGTTQKTEPKKPSLSEWLTETGSRLTDAATAEDVETIVSEEMVQKALVSLKNGSLALLTEQIATARERTKVATEDGDASFLGGQEPVENDPALAQQDAEAA